jgi:hypothetical protein
MFIRRLVVSLFVAASVVGLTAGIALSGGFKGPSFIPPVPPALNVPLPAKCQVHLEQTVEFNCWSTLPNPNPPKDTITVKTSFGQPKVACKVTAYPDGDVTMTCRVAGGV